jgi:hypothetical protein
MTLLRDIARTLLGMFLADARLTIAILVLVTLVAGLILILGVDSLVGGSVLLAGCLIILVEAAVRETRRRNPL